MPPAREDGNMGPRLCCQAAQSPTHVRPVGVRGARSTTLQPASSPSQEPACWWRSPLTAIHRAPWHDDGRLDKSTSRPSTLVAEAPARDPRDPDGVPPSRRPRQMAYKVSNGNANGYRNTCIYEIHVFILCIYNQAEAGLSDRQIGILASASTYIQNMGRRTGSSSGLRCPTDASLGSIT